MHRAIKILLTTAAFGLTPALGMAQDWSGPYGGLAFGYAFGDADHSFSNLAPSGDSSPKGALVGGFLGYGFQSGNMVYGGEVDVDFNTASGSYVNTTGATSGGSTDGKWQASVRGVVGVSGKFANKSALYFATAGWATGRFDFMGGPSVAATNTYSDTLDGWTAGVGVDWRANNKTAVRLEYRYTDFGTANGALNPAFPAITMPVDVTQHVVRLGVRMDF